MSGSLTIIKIHKFKSSSLAHPIWISIEAVSPVEYYANLKRGDFIISLKFETEFD